MRGLACFVILLLTAATVHAQCEDYEGRELGLCRAYCERLDCDTYPQHSPSACQAVLNNFVKSTGSLPACETGCPCWNAEEYEMLSESFLESSQCSSFLSCSRTSTNLRLLQYSDEGQCQSAPNTSAHMQASTYYVNCIGALYRWESGSLDEVFVYDFDDDEGMTEGEATACVQQLAALQDQASWCECQPGDETCETILEGGF